MEETTFYDEFEDMSFDPVEFADECAQADYELEQKYKQYKEEREDEDTLATDLYGESHCP